ncbi:hypothetical protein [Psychroserpens mesophilus]|uniref:hypothetical protein n=1 Tax=Psychroserpens mesophilus TaxID=325473 RepID=UPI0005910D0A|nr:hypothetical protein [Psychroserpens mesophilus]
MTIFESLNNTTDEAVNNAENYIKTSQSYLRLKVFQQITLSLSLIVKLVIIGGLLTLALIFTAVSSALAIGEALGSISAGYLIVGACFLIMALIVYYFRKHIERKIISSISEKYFD